MDIRTELEQARDACDRGAWQDGLVALRMLDAQHHLGVDDLERLAVAAHLTGNSAEALLTVERVHHLHLESGVGGGAAAARWAIWLGVLHAMAGNHAQGGGWLARAARILDEADLDVAERGFLQVPKGLQALERGDHAAADEIFTAVLEVARRLDDTDLLVLGLLGRGRAAVAAGAMPEGALLLDEAMVAVTTGDVIELIAGIAYCAVIIACRDAFDRRRAREWTAALDGWCDEQQGLHPFRGQCLVHRSEILQFGGDWADAREEIRAAIDHLSRHPGDPVMGMARYQEAELLRLCGELDAAEVAYREASAWGHPPQPGLALLRLAQGRVDEAMAAVSAVLEQHPADPSTDAAVKRAATLSAAIEICLADGDLAAAARAATELEQVAEDFGSDYLRACAASGLGAVALAAGDTATAGAVLRKALHAWQRLDAPYEAARVRTTLARSYRAAGDLDSAAVELELARATFVQLGAAGDVSALDDHEATQDPVDAIPGGLTPREVEVLRLVATGISNREVAEVLVISERTVARHLSNLFTKLGVSTRSAATAWAWERGLR